MAARRGSCHAPRQPRTTVTVSIPSVPPSGIALFDLDGTLLAWDCQLLFRHFVLRKEPWRGLFLPLFLLAVPFAGLLGAARLKRVFLSYLWRMPPQRLATYCRDFAQSLMPAIYPELREKLDRQRAAGHLLILASASPECYVAEIGRELGFDLALGTPVHVRPAVATLAKPQGRGQGRTPAAIAASGVF